MKQPSYVQRIHAGKLLAAAAVCLMMFSSISDTLAINTYVHDLKGMATPVTTYNVERSLVALTFDVGLPGDNPGDIVDILEELRAQKVKATFFLTGEWVEQNPRTALAVYQAGHEIGRSLYSYRKNADNMTADALTADMLKTDRAWKKAGLPDGSLFRVPHGAADGAVAKVIRTRHQNLISWSIDAAPHSVASAAMAAAGLNKEGLRPGAIIRLRIDEASREALPQLIQNIKLADYRLATISELQRETEVSQ
ncbi:MAG TPA: polysaccharide deacetylase family protein [Bacilli bacterium]|nr:polysaccharide deacetylase family protein [Bacilli bacterium]